MADYARMESTMERIANRSPARSVLVEYAVDEEGILRPRCDAPAAAAIEQPTTATSTGPVGAD